MENKIQELTDKIYREGVEKGNEEAQRLIANAQEEAKKIIEDARKEAESIVNSSRKSADELVENTKSELKLFAGQAVNALKSEVATMVTDKLVTTSVKDFAQDKDYLNAFIVALASKWSIDEPIVISTADAESLKKYFAAHAKALLDKGVIVGHKTGTGDCNAKGQQIGCNDIGFVVLPDGHTYSIAVFVKDSEESSPENSKIIADVSRIVYEYVMKTVK